MAASPISHLRIVRLLGKQRYLLASLFGFLIVGQLLQDFAGSRLVMYALLLLVVITGPLAVAASRAALAVTWVLAGAMLIPGVFSDFSGTPQAYQFSMLLGTVFFGFLAGLITKELLFRAQVVDGETLWAAVNVYILIGICFAFAYGGIASINQDVFVGRFMDRELTDQIYGFVYFSFVTLTTLGYGDITPNDTLVGTLTYIEALIGQLYVAILIARLVGSHISQRGDS
jgi:voltage-gated potassium channel